MTVFILLTSLMLAGMSFQYYITRTESGMLTVWRYAEKFIPGNIQIDNLHGNLHDQISFDRLTYSIDGTTVYVNHASISANIWALLGKRILVHHLQADSITIQLPASRIDNNQPSRFTIDDLMTLLRSIHIDQAAINTININQNNINLLDISSLHINFDRDGHPIISASIKAANIGTSDYYVSSINGNISNLANTPQQIHAQLTLHTIHINNIVVPSAVMTIDAKIKNHAALIKSAIAIDKSNHIVSNIQITQQSSYLDASQGISGDITLSCADLSLFNALISNIPKVKSIHGAANAVINLSGTLANPAVKGTFSLINAGFVVPEFNTQAANINVQADYSPTKPISFNGAFNIGEGRGTINGTANIANNAIETNLSIKGTNLRAVNTTEYKITIDPDITINYTNHTVNISGDIIIPAADIMPTDFSTTVSLPSEVVIVNQKTSPAIPTNLGLSIQFKLGDRINFKFHDLTAKLTGSLNISQRPGSLPRATGELSTVNGTYKAYGKTLIIQTGRLTYAGNLLTNPGIDLRAIQHIRSVGYAAQSQFNSSAIQPVYTGTDTITVGVWIRGTINKPILTLFSEPAGLSQGDILSYLVLGQPQSLASGSSGLSLLGMASSSYSGGAGNVTDKLQNTLGLSEFSVGSTEYYDTTSNSTQSASTVNLGRNLGRNLSLHYNIGLFSSLSIFSLRYDISKHFAIQSETSALENGGDLLYQVEGGE